MKKLILALALAMCAAAFAVEATVVSVKGKVEMQEGSRWIAVQRGNRIEKGSVISTGFNSEAVVEFKGTKFTFGALTRATIEDLMEDNDKDTANVFIDSGKISADVNSTDGKRVGFKVRSPVATASVRGTVFTFSAAGTLSVDRGLVSFAPTGEGASATAEKSVPVAAGQQSKIDAESNVCSSPAEEKAKVASGGNNSTTTLAAEEAVSTAPSSVAAAVDSTAASTSTPTTATLNITLEF